MPPALAQMLHIRTELGRWGKFIWRPKAADLVLSFRIGYSRIDRILHFYHVFLLFAPYEDISLLAEFFSRKVEQ